MYDALMYASVKDTKSKSFANEKYYQIEISCEIDNIESRKHKNYKL